MSDINPEWSDRMVAESTTLEQSPLPEAFKHAARRGRPASDNPKQAISIRLSPEVIAHFRATGKGWQTRIDTVLKDFVAHA